MGAQLFLFVGGPADGQRIATKGDRHHTLIINTVSANGNFAERPYGYVLRMCADEKGEHAVYFHEHIQDNFLLRLINAYPTHYLEI